jgi:hypothetical protein
MEKFNSRKWPNQHCRCHFCGLLLLVVSLSGWVAPVTSFAASSVAVIANAGTHTLALKSDGTAWAWGWNGNGALGDGPHIKRKTPGGVLVRLNGPR